MIDKQQIDTVISSVAREVVDDYVMPWAAALDAEFEKQGIGTAANPGTPEDTARAYRAPAVESHVARYIRDCDDNKDLANEALAVAYGVLAAEQERAPRTNTMNLVMMFRNEVLRIFKDGQA